MSGVLRANAWVELLFDPRRKAGSRSPSRAGSAVGVVGGLGKKTCSAGAPYLFDGGHLDVLIVVQRCIGGTHVIAKPSYRHLITVVERHGYCYASQGGDVLRGKKAGMEVISKSPFLLSKISSYCLCSKEKLLLLSTKSRTRYLATSAHQMPSASLQGQQLPNL